MRKITEQQLRGIINESIKKCLNEISFDKLEKADFDAGLDNDVEKSLDKIQHQLEYFSNSLQAKKCLEYLEYIKAFIIRKGKQKENFTDAVYDREKAYRDKLQQLFRKRYNRNLYKDNLYRYDDSVTDADFEDFQKYLDSLGDKELAHFYKING